MKNLMMLALLALVSTGCGMIEVANEPTKFCGVVNTGVSYRCSAVLLRLNDGRIMTTESGVSIPKNVFKDGINIGRISGCQALEDGVYELESTFFAWETQPCRFEILNGQVVDAANRGFSGGTF